MITLKEITTHDSNEIFDELQMLFVKMYQYMNDTGLNLKLSNDGASIWCNSIRKTLGRINYISCAFENDKMIGFGVASLRIAPPYLDNLKIGAISPIYVLQENRNSGAGKLILDELEKWFKKQNVHSIELEVLFQNEVGINFWKKNNYMQELLKMRKIK